MYIDDMKEHDFMTEILRFSPRVEYSQTFVKQPHKGITKVAAKGRWLLNRGKYQYKCNIWEHFVWLLKTGWLLNRGDR